MRHWYRQNRFNFHPRINKTLSNNSTMTFLESPHFFFNTIPLGKDVHLVILKALELQTFIKTIPGGDTNMLL